MKESLVVMKDEKKGWFSTHQPMCSPCYQSHLEGLPHWFPYRKAFRFQQVAVVERPR